jgi:prophage regulatory protein
MDDADEPKKELRKMLSLNEVLAIVPIARRSTLLRMVRLKQFPQPIYISENRRVWYEDQIIEWQDVVNNSQPERRRGRGRPRVKGGAVLIRTVALGN